MIVAHGGCSAYAVIPIDSVLSAAVQFSALTKGAVPVACGSEGVE